MVLHFQLLQLLTFRTNSSNYFLVRLLRIPGDFYGLIATRVVLGLVQGPVFPCLASFIVPWYPVDQRGKLCSIGYIGISVWNVQFKIKTRFETEGIICFGFLTRSTKRQVEHWPVCCQAY